MAATMVMVTGNGERDVNGDVDDNADGNVDGGGSDRKSGGKGGWQLQGGGRKAQTTIN